MLIAKNNEEKRSKIWKCVLTVASILLVIVIVYFIYQGFYGNPLAGRWKHDESDMVLEIAEKDDAVLTWKNLFEEGTLTLNMGFTLNKTEKRVSFQADSAEYEKAAKELGGSVTAEKIETAVDSLIATFTYSVEGGELILTESDYGDQIIFMQSK